jgi:CrcB protein
LRIVWAVAIGAAVGGVARYYVTIGIQQRVAVDFPFATFLINVTGSFVLGLLMRYALQSAAFSPEFRALVTTGFCGGYTTFSTFSYESAMLLQDRAYLRAGTYIVASVLLSLAGTFLGFAAADRLLAMRTS